MIALADASGKEFRFMYTSKVPYIQLDTSWLALFSGNLLMPKLFYIPVRTLYAECPYRWHATMDTADGVQRIGSYYSSLAMASGNLDRPQNTLALRVFGGREYFAKGETQW